MNIQDIIIKRANYHFSHAPNWSKEDREEFQVETDEIFGIERTFKPEPKPQKVSKEDLDAALAKLRGCKLRISL